MGSQQSVPPKGSSAAAQPAPNALVSFLPMVVVGFIIYFLIIRPQQKQAKELKAKVDALRPGDKVLTQAGIIGIVAAVRPESISVKIAENVKVDFVRTAISRVEDASTPAPTPGPKEVVS